MKFEFKETALKSFSKLDPSIQRKILKKLNYWQNAEDPISFAKALKGHKDLFRYRMGDWRMIVWLDRKKEIIGILDVNHRSIIYMDI